MINSDLEKYALSILNDKGCDIYTYGGEYSKYLLDDLKTAYPDGMKYPYIDVANAILAISHPRPIERVLWKMVWETDSCVNSEVCASFEEAKSRAEDTLVEWACAEQAQWKSDIPTAEEAVSWNRMINNCGVRVVKYNKASDGYDDYWVPSREELADLGWEVIQE